MIQNVGKIDRILRVVVGLALLSLLFFAEGSLRWLGVAGLVLVVTGIFSFCPAYKLIGFNSVKGCCCKHD
ncbi:MAG: DUF2892 domain-containing protein [Rhodospirillaceae bacterium]